MSLTALCSRDNIGIGRLVTTTGLSGGVTRSFTSGVGRGSLATSASCRLQEFEADELREYGVKGHKRMWKVQCTTNPSLTEQDHIFFTDADGTAIEARVIKPSRNLDGQSRLWTAVAEQLTTQV